MSTPVHIDPKPRPSRSSVIAGQILVWATVAMVVSVAIAVGYTALQWAFGVG